MEISTLGGLIDQLYNRNLDNKTLQQIQAQLQQFQRLENALAVADVWLTQDYSLYCQFFGALTYTVQLNLKLARYNPIDEDDNLELAGLVERQYSQIRHLVKENRLTKVNNQFIIKKIFSNLALIYFYYYLEWENPLRGFADIVDLNTSDGTSLMLTFSQILIEEVLKKSSLNEKISEPLHVKLKDEVFEFSKKIINGIIENNIALLNSHSPVFEAPVLNSITCLSSWLNYISFSQLNSSGKFDLDDTFNNCLQILVSHQGQQLQSNAFLVSSLLDFFTNLVTVNVNLINATVKLQLFDLIFKSWGLMYLNFNKDNFENIEEFSKLIIVYLETDIVIISKFLISDDHHYIFDILLKLTGYPGIPIVEEVISKEFIEFWLEASDSLIDESGSLLIVLKSEDNLKLFKLRFAELLNNISNIYWKKLQIPDNLEPEFKQEFMAYRRDIGELFETIYHTISADLFKKLFENLLTNIREDKNPQEIEASLFVIKTIIVDVETVDDQIWKGFEMLFESKFHDLCLNTKSIYLMTTVVNFLSRIDFFYKKHLKYLDPILNLLFHYLTYPNPSFQMQVVKSISQICKECNKHLVNSIDKFDAVVVEAIENRQLNDFVREKIINGVTYIIQEIDVPAQGEYIYKLVRLIEEKMAVTLRDTAEVQIGSDQSAMLFGYLLSLLHCILEIAKGMQIPEFTQNTSFDDYWKIDTFGIRPTILNMVNQISLDETTTKVFLSYNYTISNIQLNYHSQITEAVCLIFKAGACENYGPVVFETDVVFSFIVKKLTSLMHLLPNVHGHVSEFINLYELLTLLISINAKTLPFEKASALIEETFVNVLDYLLQDFDMYVAGLQCITVLVNKNPQLILGHSKFEQILNSILVVFKLSNEKYIIKRLSSFWIKLVGVKDPAVDSVFENGLGARLTDLAFRQLLQSARSNLDYYSDVIRAIIGKYPLWFRAWMRDCLNSVNEQRLADGAALIPVDKYIQTIYLTKGSRKSNNTLRNLWMVSNGLDY